jgi:hypothetical protein
VILRLSSQSVFSPDTPVRVIQALLAAAVAVGVTWIASNLDFSWDNLPDFSPGPLGEHTAIVVGASVGVSILILRNQGFALLWALLIPVHAQLTWNESGFVHVHPPPTALRVIAASLESSFEAWTVLAAGLLLASWVALFRDGRVGFRQLSIPILTWIVLAASVRAFYTIDWSLDQIELLVRIQTALLLLVCGIFPLAMSLWHIWVAARANTSAAPAT